MKPSLGNSILYVWNEYGELQAFQDAEYPLLFWFFLRQDESYFHQLGQENWIWLSDLEIQDFFEPLEEICGGRAARNRLEKQYQVNQYSRVNPIDDVKKRLKIKKRRAGFPQFITGVQANNNAVFEIRESGYKNVTDSIRIIVEESPANRLIDNFPEIIAELDEEDLKETINIAQLHLFQIIHLIEAIEPRLPPRTLYPNREVTAHLRHQATKEAFDRMFGDIKP